MEANKARDKEIEREWRKKKVAAWVEWPWSEISGWCRVDGVDEVLENRFLLGDVFGRLAMVSVDLSEQKKIILLALGEVIVTPRHSSWSTNLVK